jgi:hypothetical protein
VSGVVQAIPLRPERKRSGSGLSPLGCCRALDINHERQGSPVHPPSVLTVAREIIYLRHCRLVLDPLGLGIDIGEADFHVLGPVRDQAQEQHVEAAPAVLGVTINDRRRVGRR